MSRQSTKNKKYALRKIGKVFGSCVVATIITLGGVAIMAPNVTVYASGNVSDPGENNIDSLSSNDEGYKVIVPKKVIYRGNDQLDNETPMKVHTGYNGVSYILKANDVDESELEDHFNDKPMGTLFNKLYDEDEDGQTDEKYKREDAGTINEHAGDDLTDGSGFKEPRISEIKPEYPHLIDADVLYNPEDDSNHDGKPDGADGIFDDQDTIVYSNKPITVNKNSEDNVINEDGTVVLSKYYRIHVNEGEHADKDDDIYEVGTKPTVTTNEIDFKTIYEPNDQDVAGYQIEKTPGKKGTSTTTTTYTVNPETGARTANPSTTEETEKPVNKVVLVGTKPKVEEKELPFTRRYVEDKTKDKDYRETTQQGVKGKETKTTTYTLDTTNGTVTENAPTTDTEQPTEEIITVGTKPKVEEKELPFTTRYVEDKTKDKDYRETTQQGVKGKETKTTTYTLDTTNGTVTENAPTTDTEQPTEEIITVGTKPKVVETPETPQPGQPTAPEEAPAQPAQPSEPEDQPNLKVAPPTIAIVEEANKASIEVKAPKKDADTVKITYPKSDGSGEEVLTLTKQPSGEWTLDKQPENVTLDKKTGTVTIPRESVVNKQKVQARAKHKTSAYTPFVYAALSIEAANPEHPVTLWVDRAGTELKKPVVGKKELAGEIAGYKWLSSRLEEGILTHTFEKVANGTPILPESPTSHPMTPSSSPSTSTPEKPNKAETPAVRTVWRDENGKDLKVPSVDKQEAGEVPGYEFVESYREGDNLIVHVFRTKQAQTPAPKDQTPNPEQAASPAPSKVSEQKGEAVATATSEKTVDSATSTKTSDKAELPNTGTEANATLASAGIMTLLAGLGLGFFKKKED